MIKKVPREELEALFEVLYSYEVDKKASSYSYNIEFLYRFYAYKFLKLINKNAVNICPIPIKLINFNIQKITVPLNKVKPFLSFDIENKYMLYLDFEDNHIIFDVFKESVVLNQSEDVYSFVYDTFSNLMRTTFDEINLKATQKESVFYNFFDDEVLRINYNVQSYAKEFKINLYLDKSLFDSEIIDKFIFVKPTSLEQKNLKILKSKITTQNAN